MTWCLASHHGSTALLLLLVPVLMPLVCRCRWAGDDEQRIAALGHQVHLLPNSGHWVHTDNPNGLFEIMAPTFRV
jgi:pimeloyl-ACP methyl ester carboxylesterase